MANAQVATNDYLKHDKAGGGLLLMNVRENRNIRDKWSNLFGVFERAQMVVSLVSCNQW